MQTYVAIITFAVAMSMSYGFAKDGSDHPTLPTMWTAETVDPPMGKGEEQYNFVDTPSDENPSAMWSIYPGCKRLIYVPTPYTGKRYLMGCDSISCCWESQDGNQVEFQIPNIHYTNPKKEVEVSYQRANITNFGEKMEADEWSWSLGKTEKFWAYTEDCSDCYLGVRLLQWKVQVGYHNPTVIQFKNYKGIDPNSEEGKEFDESFAIPEECQANNLLQCPSDLEKNYFGKNVAAPATTTENKPPYRSYGSTCTGPHEFCCEAPNGDPSNCPPSAYTSDCAAKNSCCCA
jgi:hypothetical protein